MKQKRSALLLALIVAVIAAGCAPPWHGEEDNFPIVALAFEDTVTHRRLPWADLGITGLENVEHQRNLPIGNAFAQPGMNFDSRLDEVEWLLLPIDKADTIQTFVLHHPNGPDTLRFAFDPKYGVERDGDWDGVSWFINLVYSTFPALGAYYVEDSYGDERYYHPQIIEWLWVAL